MKAKRLKQQCNFIFAAVIVLCLWYHYEVREKFKIEMISFKLQEEDTVPVLFSNSNTEILNVTEIMAPTNLDATLNLDKPMKTILIWTLPNRDPFIVLLWSNEAFIKRKCKVKNCYITTDKDFMNITDFDVILFNGPEIMGENKSRLPAVRSPKQNYVFASIESSHNYPVCHNRSDSYFNISWTYKLSSDIYYGYLIVRNVEGEIIGPKKEMHWLSVDKMKPVNETIKQKLSSKKKLAAFLVSNCNARSRRDQFVKLVQDELKRLGTNLTVDIYGRCGTIACVQHRMPYCLQMFEHDYYFYFSFENSLSEDYVTEKLLFPLQHYLVPVVYGLANYTRFIPNGIYLNALSLGPQKLARRMLDLVAHKEEYYSYFQWINHYSYHDVEESPETDVYCKFCEAMNDRNLMSRTTGIENFNNWWNPKRPYLMKMICGHSDVKKHDITHDKLPPVFFYTYIIILLGFMLCFLPHIAWNNFTLAQRQPQQLMLDCHYCQYCHQTQD